MANDQDLLKELLQSSMSQVEDYAATIRETAQANLDPDNIPAVYQINSALLCIDELATQLDNLVLLCKAKLKQIVPEPTEQSGDDDVDPDDVVPFDWIPSPKYDYLDTVWGVYYDTDGDLRDEFDGII